MRSRRHGTFPRDSNRLRRCDPGTRGAQARVPLFWPDMDKSREKSERTTRLRKGSRTEARSLATIEIHLEATETAVLDPMEPLLDRSRVRRIVEELTERLVPEGSDEWTDSPTDARVLVGQDRLLLRMTLPDESREQLAQRIDRLYDLAFDLAGPLRLEVVDPQLGTTVTRFRYEQQFQRFLDAYFTRARTAAALASNAGWTRFEDGGSFADAEVLAIETEPEALPPTIWSPTKRPLGVLEFSGDRALAALEQLRPESPFLLIVPLNAEPGDDAAVLRVKRMIRPVPGLALVEVAAEGVQRIKSLDRTAGVPRGSLSTGNS